MTTGLNTYVFERRVIHWEEETVYASNLQEAWEKVGEGDVEESTLGEFHDYYDDEHRLLEEIFNDPLVKMVEEYSEPHQYSLFDSEYVKKYKQNKLDNHFIEA